MNQENKFVYRITYEKGERVKYISHLDFIRCWGRAFKRAKMPVKYSNGFNPHILLNIALPCPVGVSSSCEMLDIAFVEKIACDEIKEKMTSALPDAIRVLKVEENAGMNDFYDILSASYTVMFNSSDKINIDEFNNAESFMIEKKSKRGMKEVNIKDFVQEVSLLENDGCGYKIRIRIDAGNQSNLKPDLLLGAMQSFFGATFSDIYINRDEIFYEK